MIQAARRVILCVDHTKFGRQSISRLCDLDAISTLITDQTPPADIFAALERAGIELIVTSSGVAPVLPGWPDRDSRAAASAREAAAERKRFID